MSLSPLGNANYTQTGANSGAASTAGANVPDSTASTSSTAQSASTASSAPESSTTVTLSPQAQVLAKANSLGITMTMSSIANLDLPPLSSLSTPAEFAAFAQKLNSVLVTPPTNPTTHQQDGEISQQDFEQAAEQFGETKAQADQLFQSLDGNGSDSVSNAELLSGLAGTSTDPGSATSQSLLGMMDTNHDGSASETEYLTLETALVAAEKAPS